MVLSYTWYAYCPLRAWKACENLTSMDAKDKREDRACPETLDGRDGAVEGPDPMADGSLASRSCGDVPSQTGLCFLRSSRGLTQALSEFA
jgi:hypothetical protein